MKRPLEAEYRSFIIVRADSATRWTPLRGHFCPGGKKEMIATIKVVEGMRPGVVGFPLGYGHWACDTQDVMVKGQVIKGDPRRGGSVGCYDTRVKLVKA